MKITTLFLLVTILMNISDAKRGFIPIACNSIATGNISANNRPDLFRFTLNTPSYVKITTCPANFDTIFTLKNSSNITIYYPHTFIIWNGPECLSRYGSESIINELNRGVYTFIVSKDELTNGNNAGAYNLSLQCNTSTVSTTEIPLETSSTMPTTTETAKATRIACNSMTSGSLSINNRVDLFKFTLNTPSHVKISACDSHFDSTLTLKNSSDITIDYNDDSDNECIERFGSNSVINKKLNNGDYIFIVRGYEDRYVGVYNLSLQCNPVSTTGIPLETSSTMVATGNCMQYGCGIGFECDVISGECIEISADCNVFDIDEYLLECSDAFQNHTRVIYGLKRKIDDLELELLESNSETIPFFNYLKDILVVLLYIINVLVVMCLCYDKGTKRGKGYVDVKTYIDDEEASLQN